MGFRGHVFVIDRIAVQLIADCCLAASDGTGDGSNAVAFVAEQLDFSALGFRQVRVVFS
jgi:hypothetical protein